MALSDELEKTASERYALVKIIPSFKLNSFLSVKSGNTYEATFTTRYELSAIKVDGVSYTESATQNPSSTEYYWDIETGTFEINFGAAIGTKEAAFFHILRFTDSDNSVFDEDGVKNAVSSYHWEPRLSRAPEFSINIKNALVGIPTISTTNFVIDNEDLYLNTFLGGENSFYNKDVFISLFINETVYAKYQGKTKSVDPSGNKVSFTVYDTTYNLNNDCLMGDSSEESYYNIGIHTEMDRKHDGKIIPYVIGRSAFAFVQESDTSSATYPVFRFDTEKTSEAVCLDVTDSLTWGLCRGGSQGNKAIDYGDADTIGFLSVEVSATMDYGTSSNNRSGFEIEISEGTHNIELLDTIEMVKSSTTYSGVVTAIGNNGNDLIQGIMEPGAATGSYDNVTAFPKDSIGLMLVQGENYFYLDVDNDYTLQVDTLTSGNKFYKVVLSSGFESGHTGMTTINYETDRLFYRYTEDTAVTNETAHGYAVRRILEASGTTVVSGSIPPEGNPAGSDVNMMIPKLGETSVRNFSHYLGLVLKSMFGYIYQDVSSLETKYRLFNAPSASNIILKNEINDLSISFDGNDMAKDVTVKNDNTYYYYTNYLFSSPAYYAPKDKTNTKTTSSYIASNQSVYQHGLKNSKTEECAVIKTNIRETEKKAFIENEQMFVTFSTNMKYANLNIGEDVSLEDDRIPGTKTTVNGVDVMPMKILGIKNSPDKITFTCVDLKGL